MRPARESCALMLALYASTFFFSWKSVLAIYKRSIPPYTVLTFIQSGRFGPHPRHLIMSLLQVLHESPSRCSSHLCGQLLVTCNQLSYYWNFHGPSVERGMSCLKCVVSARAFSMKAEWCIPTSSLARILRAG